MTNKHNSQVTRSSVTWGEISNTTIILHIDLRATRSFKCQFDRYLKFLVARQSIRKMMFVITISFHVTLCLGSCGFLSPVHMYFLIFSVFVCIMGSHIFGSFFACYILLGRIMAWVGVAFWDALARLLTYNHI